MSNQTSVLRGRIGIHSPSGRHPDPVKHEQAKAALVEVLAANKAQAAADRIAAFAERIVAQAPPLNAEQRDRITQALRKAGA